jgi:hypothetical protein
MTKEDISKIEDLLDDSLETIQDKKQFAKTQKQILKECAQKSEILSILIKSSDARACVPNQYEL